MHVRQLEPELGYPAPLSRILGTKAALTPHLALRQKTLQDSVT